LKSSVQVPVLGPGKETTPEETVHTPVVADVIATGSREVADAVAVYVGPFS